MQESIAFLVRVQCRRKESSRSLSHLMMSFLSVSDEVLHLIVRLLHFFADYFLLLSDYTAVRLNDQMQKL